MGKNWQLLVVDDEPDVHSVTRIALRRRRWQGRGFDLIRADSGQAAKALIAQRGATPLDLVLTDGVMESMTAGFELGEFVRREAGLRVPVILRSGIYSELYVRKHYGGVFDAVVPKAESTADGLFEAIRTCLGRALRAGSVSAVA